MFWDLSSGCSLSRVSETCRHQHAAGQNDQSVRDCSVKADITPAAGAAVSRENTVKEKIAFDFFSCQSLADMHSSPFKSIYCWRDIENSMTLF